MKRSLKPRSAISTLLTAAIVMLVAAGLYACANPDKPDGGPYDETPPSVVRTSPAQYAVGNKERKITLWFDEYIKLDNAQDKIVISPPQLEQPEIQAYGRRITVNLKDTLIPNTTYTIDFSDAIVDNNESNPMGSYAFVFSTGDKIDTMEVSGTVLNAEDLEPVKGMLVGLHSNMADSAFTTTPLEHIGRTDSRGHFVIKGVAPGKYRIYALNDAENDFKERLAHIKEVFKNSQAAKSVLDDYKRTRKALSTVAGSIAEPDSMKLRQRGLKRMNFQSHNYFILFRIVENRAEITNVFHFLEDYENKLR